MIALFVSARWYPDDPGDRPPAGQIAWRVLAGRGTLVVAPSSTSFTFPTAVSFRTAYSVTVMSDPAGLTCSASNASSTVPASNSTNTVGTTTVANIAAACPAR